METVPGEHASTRQSVYPLIYFNFAIFLSTIDVLFVLLCIAILALDLKSSMYLHTRMYTR